MKKTLRILAIIICYLSILPANSQTLEKMYHSKELDIFVAKVDSALRSNATWVNGSPRTTAKYCCDDLPFYTEKTVCLDSMIFIPFYCNVSFSNNRPTDSLTKDYFLSWKFLKDLDSLSKQGKTFLDQPRIYMYDYFHREVYEVKGWSMQKGIMNCRLECCCNIDGESEFLKFVAEMYYGGWIDFAFGYPTVWEPGHCSYIWDFCFAVKDERLFVIYVSQSKFPVLYPFEEMIDCNWNKIVRQK